MKQKTLAWTLLRPTMIYGADTDLNVTFIKAIICKFGFFPLPWGAKGLRQPVHVMDLASACVAVLDCKVCFNRAYNLGGGEVIEFAEMVRRIFHSQGKKPWIVYIPKWLYLLAIKILAKLPRYSFLRGEMVERMFADLTVDNEPAMNDFGYKPQAFGVIELTEISK